MCNSWPMALRSGMIRQHRTPSFGKTPPMPHVGPYHGKLPNSSGDVVLRRPSPPELDGQIDYVMIEHVVYSDNAPWPADADGAGFSLQRVSETGFANDPTN